MFLIPLKAARSFLVSQIQLKGGKVGKRHKEIFL